MSKGTINREYDLCSNMKTNLIPLIMRELQIRNTLRNHVLCIKLSNIKKFDNIPYWYKCKEIGTLIHCSWVYKLVQSLWRAICQHITNLNIYTSFVLTDLLF